MSTPWDTLSAAITRLTDRVDALPAFREASVAWTNPLQILFDTDVDPVLVHSSLVRDPQPGDRVLTLKIRHYVWVIGVKGGAAVDFATRADFLSSTPATKPVSPGVLKSVGPLRYKGTQAERGATTAQFGDMWHDTDGDRFVWKGATNGTWRRFSGANSVSEGAWSYTNTTPALAARNVTWTLPTVLEPSESLLITAAAVGSGFGAFSLSSITRNATNTTTVVRQTQIGSTTTNGGTINWQIIEIGA